MMVLVLMMMVLVFMMVFMVMLMTAALMFVFVMMMFVCHIFTFLHYFIFTFSNFPLQRYDEVFATRLQSTRTMTLHSLFCSFSWKFQD